VYRLDYTGLPYVEDIEYVYSLNDANFLSDTKGCGNKCGFVTYRR